MYPNVIGVLGKAGHGKDTLVDHLVAKHGFYRPPSFSTPLKAMLVHALLVNPPMFYVAMLSGKDQYEFYNDPKAFWERKIYRERDAFTRWLMQFVGTELFRGEVNRDWWVNKWAPTGRRLTDEGHRLAICDVRFNNEAALIRDMGGELWRVIKTDDKSRGIEAGEDHSSELEADNIRADVTIAVPTGIHYIHQAADIVLKGATPLGSAPVVG